VSDLERALFRCVCSQSDVVCVVCLFVGRELADQVVRMSRDLTHGLSPPQDRPFIGTLPRAASVWPYYKQQTHTQGGPNPNSVPAYICCTPVALSQYLQNKGHIIHEPGLFHHLKIVVFDEVSEWLQSFDDMIVVWISYVVCVCLLGGYVVRRRLLASC
jgi:hypothetical protein